MKKFSFFIFCLTIFVTTNAQQANFNFELLSNVVYPEGCNDIWGYVDENGIEYAILGTKAATAVLSLEDPTNPIERAYIAGDNTIWRDIKTWNKRAYVVADASDDGLLIINLELAPDSISYAYQNTSFDIDGNTYQLRDCHNLYIDEKGIMYISGSGQGNGGVLIFDLNEDPDNPKFIGYEGRFYSHDCYVRGDTLYSSDLSNGMSIWDVSQPENPQQLGRTLTTSAFAHNGWLSDDGKYFYTTDEVANGYMDAYDVSDPSNIQLLDVFRPKATEGRGVIPHNAHYKDGYLVTSWYTDGIKIIDGSRPHNMIEVGSYDTWLGQDGGFNGCWGAFPWMPSGVVLGADITSGLYVLRPTYQRACYLEGIVTNDLDSGPVPNVEVTIVSTFDNLEYTNSTGAYATGLPTSGTYNVTFSHPNFQDTTVSVFLDNGIVVNLDMVLRAAPHFRVNVSVIDKLTGQPVPEAQVAILNDYAQENATMDVDGKAEVIVFQNSSDLFSVVAGKWGYLHGVVLDVDLSKQKDITVELERGYQDDFLFDQGWTVDGSAPRGNWVLADPIGTDVFGELANPEDDVDTDWGNQCYVTGNEAGGAGQADVDDGVTRLISPAFDLSNYTQAILSYRTWFYNGSRPNPNDSLRILLTDGMDTVVLETITQSQSQWNDSSIFILNTYFPLSAEMSLMIEAYDDVANGHVVEGGFDEFRITGQRSTDQKTVYNTNIGVHPSITSGRLYFENLLNETHEINIISSSGHIVLRSRLTAGQSAINIDHLPQGSYIIQLQSLSQKAQFKIVKI